MSKNFLCFHFVVDQVFSISRYDLGNGRMPCKQNIKYGSKKSNFDFALLLSTVLTFSYL